MHCEFENRKCIRCGYELDERVQGLFVRTCGPRKVIPLSVCRHRTEVVGTIKVHCGCSADLIETREVRKCEVHGRCLPGYGPQGKHLRAWQAREPESSIYKLCVYCDERELVVPAVEE